MSSPRSNQDNQEDQHVIVTQLHPTSQYYMRPEVGPLIAKGLAVVYKEKPNNPVDYLAKWLLLEDWKAKQARKDDLKQKKIEKLKAQDDYYYICKMRIILKRETDQRVLE